MRLFHYLEIQNFKRFGDQQRIDLDHPAVLIGPNNCGKTTAIQAIALWSQAVKNWYDSKGKAPPKARTSTSLNRLNLVSVPVQRTRYFWHNTVVRKRNVDVQLVITLGVLYENKVEPVTMRFRNQGEELIYCTPDESTMERPELIEAAARLNVDLLYPMSGLETEEPILQRGRIDVLLGQGQTAQTLRNLCLLVYKKSPKDWEKITDLITRLFSVKLQNPQETTRGSIDLFYQQSDVKDPLDIALAGRGLQQMLLIFAYLYSHRSSVLLIDEPDAHLEILRQKQVYVLLRAIADENESQVILVTHSEVILEESLDRNLTLLLSGQADDVANRHDIRTALKHYGAQHYIRARQRGYVLYVEGRTDLDILRSLAKHLDHPVEATWDERVNVFYVQDNYPGEESDINAEIERVEGGFGLTPKQHFFALRSMLPNLTGLAIMDRDRSHSPDIDEGGLLLKYWERYEVENYFITPEVLKSYAKHYYSDMPLWITYYAEEIDAVLDSLILNQIFKNRVSDFKTWRELDVKAARLVWEATTKQIKLSDFGEAFFRNLANQLGHAMLLRKGDLHKLVEFTDPNLFPGEISETLDLLKDVFDEAEPDEV